MANLTQLLLALQNLPQTQGGTQLFPSVGPAAMPDTPAPPMSIAGPEAPPVAPGAPLNPDIIRQYLALLGPAPAPPPTQAPAGVLDKIAAALGGVSAGIQGYGPQYVQSLRAQREQPQREYQARLDQYNQQKQQFGLRGLEAAQSAEERRQDREQRVAERQFERDFQENARRAGITDTMALDKLRDAMQTQRDKERERAQDERQQEQIKAQKEKDARTLENQLISKDFVPPEIAKEIANYTAGKIETLSQRTRQYQSAQAKKLQAQADRLSRIGAGGAGGGGGNVQATIVGPDGNMLGTLPYGKIKFNRLGEPEGFPPGSQIRLQNQPRQAAQAETIPGPYNPALRPQAGAAAPRGGKTITMDQLKVSAKQAGISVTEAVRQFREAGYSMRP